MKNIVIISIASILLGVLAFTFPSVDSKTNSAEGIEFKKSQWKDILVLAKKEKKLIFLDIYATWCGPCKKLKSKTFTDKAVGNYYNANFINVTLDGEIGEGLELAKKYKINAYPTLLFINEEGTVVAETVGFYNAKEFLKLGKATISN